MTSAGHASALHSKVDLLVVPDLSSCTSAPGVLSEGRSLGGLSPLGSRRPSSVCSSILDLSGEADQLERAIKDNDVVITRRILQLHHGKFPVNLHASILDKSSCGARSRCNSQVSQDVDILLRKSQTLIDRYDRRESLTTEAEVPLVFRTSLHLAIQHNSLDVLKVLLRYGIDPNEPRGCTRRESSASQTPFSPTPRAALTTACQQWASGRGQSSLSPSPASHSSQYPLNGDGQTLIDAGNKYSRIVSEKPFDFPANYRANELLNLPPLYTAVSAGKFHAVQLLLRYGAFANCADNQGCTPLHLAAFPEFYNRECAILLLANGGRIAARDDHGVTPLDLCPSLQQEQRNLVANILSAQPYPRNTELLSLLSGSIHNANINTCSTNVSRFFKRLNSDSRVRSKDKKSRETGFGSEMRERASSAGSYRSLKGHRERGQVMMEDRESVTSVVSKLFFFMFTGCAVCEQLCESWKRIKFTSAVSNMCMLTVAFSVTNTVIIGN